MNGIDLGYGIFLAGAWPWWMLRPAARAKAKAAMANRMGRVSPRNSDRPAALIHAVSLGEVNATPALVKELAAREPDLQFIISTTTDTGFAQAKKLYDQNSDVFIVRYPLDFSSAVARFLNALKPTAVVLMELELWPNFMRACRHRQIPVILVNGRITERSFNRYRLVAPVARRMFRSLAYTCAQDQVYANRFITLGSKPATTHVTGTMKFDTAKITDRADGTDALLGQLPLQTDEPLWLCASTGPGEEEICLDIFNQLQKEFPRLRLAIVPRKPERFDEVAELIQRRGLSLFRRSNSRTVGNASPVILGDTMGELRKFYSLASVVFVGRSLLDLGQRQRGSDMIEPAALAKPVIVGPFTDNFREVMNAFHAAHAIVEIKTADELRGAVASLLKDSSDLGQRARQVVIDSQGATARHAGIVLGLLPHAARGMNS